MAYHQQFQREHMRRRQIGDMNIVADGGAVRRVVVVAEHREVPDVTLQRHHRAGNEMGFVVAQFADPARRISAAGVEIAQAKCAQSIGAAIIREHSLDHPFRRTVRVDRRAGIVFGEGAAVGVAIDRAGGGEHQAITAGLAHRIEQRQRAGDIVLVIFPRVDDRLADQARSREVHYRDDTMLREDASQRGLVQEVADD
jgi:hypothetical protein